MKMLKGTYHNGKLTLDEPYETDQPVRVTLAIDSKVGEDGLKLSDFSFLEMQALLDSCQTSFCDELLNERRSAQ